MLAGALGVLGGSINSFRAGSRAEFGQAASGVSAGEEGTVLDAGVEFVKENLDTVMRQVVQVLLPLEQRHSHAEDEGASEESKHDDMPWDPVKVAADKLIALPAPAVSLSNALSAAQRLAVPSSVGSSHQEPSALLDVVLNVIPSVLKTRASAPQVPDAVRHGIAKATLRTEVMQKTETIATSHPPKGSELKVYSIEIPDAESLVLTIDRRSRLPRGKEIVAWDAAGKKVLELSLREELSQDRTTYVFRGERMRVGVENDDSSDSSDDDDDVKEWGFELKVTGVGTTTTEIQPTVTASETGEDAREGVSPACVMLAAVRAQGSKMMDSLLQSLSVGSSVDPAKVRQLLPALMSAAGSLDEVIEGTDAAAAAAAAGGAADSPMSALKGLSAHEIEERLGMLQLLAAEGPVSPAVTSPPKTIAVDAADVAELAGSAPSPGPASGAGTSAAGPSSAAVPASRAAAAPGSSTGRSADPAVVAWYTGYDEDDEDAASGAMLDGDDDDASTSHVPNKTKGGSKTGKLISTKDHPAFSVLDKVEGGGEGSEGDDGDGADAPAKPSGAEGFGGRLAGSLLYGHLLALESLNAQNSMLGLLRAGAAAALAADQSEGGLGRKAPQTLYSFVQASYARIAEKDSTGSGLAVLQGHLREIVMIPGSGSGPSMSF